MTIEEAKVLLDKNSVSYQLREFENEVEFCHHVLLYPYTKDANSCKVIAVIILSKNTHKNIVLQFNTVNGSEQFIDLWFGGFAYEMFDYTEERLADELTQKIFDITSGKTRIIIAYDFRTKRWLGETCFDISDNVDDFSGIPGFQKAMKKIQKKKNFFARLLKIQTQYEIYDWDTYQCIVK